MKAIIKRLMDRIKLTSKGNRPAEVFKYKYANFKELLNSNTELGKLIQEISEALEGKSIFGMGYVKSRAAIAIAHAQRMVRALNAISNNGYLGLLSRLEEIQRAITISLSEHVKELPRRIVVPFDQITKELVDLVGGKSANLGEAKTRAGVPVPEGFAITTYAFKVFMEKNDLFDLIEKKKLEIEPSNPKSALELSEEIQSLILQAEVPGEIKERVMEALADLEAQIGPSKTLSLAMRSSAIGEDSDLSFAGQYVSMLNVTKERVFWAYKVILASLYTARAIVYRHNMGLRDEDIYMAVACIRMVNSRSSGVIYTVDPSEPYSRCMVLSSVWGLGPYAVDGTISPDLFHVSRVRPFSIMKRSISHKPIMLVMGREGALVDQEVPKNLRDLSSVSDQEIQTLSQYAMALETHFKTPQDLEWAIEEDGSIFILQTRPLQLPENFVEEDQEDMEVEGPLLFSGGEAAYKGIGCGPAFYVRNEDDLARFPKGAVLVAMHSSPEYAVVIPIASAIVTDAGSVTGHMASVAREFKVPCILNTKIATNVIPPNEEITVDSRRLKVYKGKPKSPLRDKSLERIMSDTAVYKALQNVASHILPLNLTDPRSKQFEISNIKTIHDLMRFVHEKSYSEMFKLSDSVSDEAHNTFKVKARLPIDLYVIDLGDGINYEKAVKRTVKIEDIKCEPLLKLLKGMIKERNELSEPRPVNFKGLLSVIAEQMVSPPNVNIERFGDKSYAIISDKYMNFSSRVGYHYSIIDTYCGETLVKNYITFYFMGGAADELRRGRRA
ncbi:MAG: PEP/pyruvate-binding domain-containing protein, partial [Desulfatiglandales bacterium]